MKKKLISAVLCVTLVVSMFVMPVSAQVYGYEYQSVELTIEEQTERLLDLQRMLANGTLPIPLNIYGEAIEIPNINLIAPPLYGGTTFRIGLEIDTEGLAYGEWDEIIQLTSQPPQRDVVDFILGFTGIGYEMAEVAYAANFYAPPLPFDYPIPEVCPVWGDTPLPRLASLRMGNLIYVDGVPGRITAGHPATSTGSTFLTATHRVNTLSRAVHIRVPANQPYTTRIGTVTRCTFGNNLDIAIVTLASTGSHMSTDLPWGGRISQFRAAARVNDSVRSIRGFSGVVNSTVVGINVNTETLSNQILISPNGPSSTGDSGAALIRADGSVLGTRGGVTVMGSAHFGRYTNVTLY